jgi:hypothetical protein
MNPGTTVAAERSYLRHSARPLVPTRLASLYLVSAVLLVYVLTVKGAAHWFVVPIGACGFLTVSELIRWLRKELDLFDPRLLANVVLMHLTFTAPLLHIAWDRFGWDLVMTDDWRKWFGYMGILNLVSLLLFRLTERLGYRTAARRKHHTWRFDRRRLTIIFATFSLVSLGAYLFLMDLIGGYGSQIDMAGPGDELSGYGWLVTLSDALPLLIGFMLVYRWADRKHPAWAIGTLLFVTCLQLLWAGLRGSRSTLIFIVVMTAAMIHLNWQPLRRRFVLLAAIALIAFMYFYGFFKFGGPETVQQLVSDPSGLAYYERNLATGEDFGVEAIVLGDLSRADVQTYILYSLINPRFSYRYRLGETYLAGVLSWVPRLIWSHRPPPVQEAYLELLYGPGTYNPLLRTSHRVFGLAGEAMLNFGVLAPLFAYSIYGFAIGALRSRLAVWRANNDARLFIAPLLLVISMIAVTSDLRNLVFFIFKHTGLYLAIVLLASRRQSLAPRLPVGTPPGNGNSQEHRQ